MRSGCSTAPSGGLILNHVAIAGDQGYYGYGSYGTYGANETKTDET